MTRTHAPQLPRVTILAAWLAALRRNSRTLPPYRRRRIQLGRETGIVEPALIEEASGAVRTRGPGERGDRVNHEANVYYLPNLLGATHLRMPSRNYRSLACSRSHRAYAGCTVF